MTEHQHGHGHSHGGASSTRVLILSLVFTTAFAGVEVLGGIWANSLALIADAGHMITDSLSLGIGAFAAWLSRRRASKRHTYGFARAETIGALVNTLFMLGVVVWIVVAALDRLTAPVEVGGVLVMVIAFIGLLVNVAVAWLLMRGENNMNVRAALLHVMGDLAGSVAALASGLVIYLTGWLLIDPLLSLFISVLIGIASINVLRDVLHVLMEGTPKDVDPTEITQALRGIDGVLGVHHLHVWSLSSSRHALSAEIEVEALEAWEVIMPRLQRVLGDRFDLHHCTLQPQTQRSRARAEPAISCQSFDP
ncbi:cation diffusion facilitator family transporter [Salinisphaera japonica]|uniref:Cation transporter n=1 Tax=Salinisphaera japonica YTM-1 TaxID=1209778 RepID=A0A423PFB7_9GAMM|nr:cation diffusion facilitator family transporter [Salinisphaera japonica]ROO24329.1 cation transporter [Salinisphaera japonica YTM-1]